MHRRAAPACGGARRIRRSSPQLPPLGKSIATSTRSAVWRNHASSARGAASRPPSVPSRWNGTRLSLLSACGSLNRATSPRALHALRICNRTQPGCDDPMGVESAVRQRLSPNHPCRQSRIGAYGRSTSSRPARPRWRAPADSPMRGRARCRAPRPRRRSRPAVRRGRRSTCSAVKPCGCGWNQYRPERFFTSKRIRLAPTGRDRVEAGAVCGLRKRQPVKVDGRGLREGVLDDGVEVVAAARNNDRLHDLPRTEVGDVLAAAGDGIRSFDQQALYSR